eukprot:364353-Chlamydomonas_euryale.AAC.9
MEMGRGRMHGGRTGHMYALETGGGGECMGGRGWRGGWHAHARHGARWDGVWGIPPRSSPPNPPTPAHPYLLSPLHPAAQKKRCIHCPLPLAPPHAWCMRLFAWRALGHRPARWSRAHVEAVLALRHAPIVHHHPLERYFLADPVEWAAAAQLYTKDFAKTDGTGVDGGGADSGLGSAATMSTFLTHLNASGQQAAMRGAGFDAQV